VTLFLLLAAFAGGALNAVAGGGSFITLPALLYAGVPPVAANAPFRREIDRSRRWVATLGGVSIAGGLLGGVLLVRTSDAAFVRLLPWLMLLAAAAFTFSRQLTSRLRRREGDAHPWWAMLLQLAIAVYGGYFGGGMGIMLLASLAIAGLSDIHEANGVKNVLAAAINGVALAEFILFGVIAWAPGVVMMAGAVAGGFAGASAARRVEQKRVRLFVVTIAWALTIYFFVAGS
jgi:uncharacterized membrane protein YfcA